MGKLNAALADPKIKTAVHRTAPADFAKFVADDTDKWAKVIRAASIKPD